jgi:hypothetical protein
MRCVLLTLAITAIGLMSPTPTAAGQAEDTAIAGQIKRNLKSSGRMQDYQIGIKVRDGTAWLIGSVANPEQALTALGIAKRSGGIKRVVNKLTAGTKAEPTARQAMPGPSRPMPGRGVSPALATGRVPAQGFNGPLTHGPAQSAVRLANLGGPLPAHVPFPSGVAPARFDQAHMPGSAWPSYAA